MHLSKIKPSNTPAGLLRVKAEEIASKHKIDMKIMLGRCKRKEYVQARRALAIYLRGLGKSYHRIGELLGRDHSSIRDMVLEGNRASKYRKMLAAKSLPASQQPSSAQADH